MASSFVFVNGRVNIVPEATPFNRGDSNSDKKVDLSDGVFSLEEIARKEVRGGAIDESEKMFLREYGEKIARIMLYGGNSYSRPRDDAPRAMDVHFNPNLDARPYLEAGIDRPRALYVLWPGKGREYLCRGAVLPYLEFTSETRLTDGEFRALLDGPDRPPVPPWLASIVSGGALGKARLEEH
jgi:hypothetical protein